MPLKIAFFGKLADRIDREIEIEIPAAGCTVAALRARVAALHPEAAADLAAGAARACVNDALAGEDAAVGPGDRIGFLPPLSGG